MNNEIPQSQIASRTVGAFFTMGEAELAKLANELGLDMSVSDLQFCKSYFEHAYRRAPLVAELLFIAEYLRVQRCSPLSLLPFDLTFASTDTARAFTDMANKSRRISPDQKHPAGPLELINVAGNYLKRAGHAPCRSDLLCADEAEVALMANGIKPRLALPLGNQLAALIESENKHNINYPMTVLAIDEKNSQLLPQITAKIMEVTSRFGAVPLMHIGNEGFFPHLSEFKNGIEIFATLSLRDQEENPYRVLNNVFRNTSLIALPEEVVSSILDTGAPLKPIGKLLPTDAVIIHYPTATVSLSNHLLRELNTLAAKLFRTEIPQKTHPHYQIHVANTEEEILCGAVCEGDVLPALFDLMLTVFKTGVNAKKIRLCATLACNRKNLPVALAAISDLHRITTELALASLPARVLSSDEEQPTLTLALAAPLLKNAPDEDKVAAFSSAVARADYAALRALLYEIYPPKNIV